MQRGPSTGWLQAWSRSRCGLRARLLCLSAAALLPVTAIHSATTPPSNPSEYEVKAAYLLNFGRFVRSSPPRAPHTSFDICILGRDPLDGSLDSLASNESIDHLPVHVRRLPDVTDAKTCSIVFISSFEGDHIREDLAILGAADVLTVSDSPDFLERGGMIQFVLVSNHVRFAVNLDAVSHAHLVLSSELLRVASSVTGKPSVGEMP